MFNVDRLSDDDIVTLARALDVLGHAASGDAESGDSDTSDYLFEALAADVRALAERDPERAKALLQRNAVSEHDADLYLAAETAESLIAYDWPAARDALIAGCLNGGELSGEAAFLKAHHLADERRLTSDQVDDFNAHIFARNPGASGFPLDQ